MAVDADNGKTIEQRLRLIEDRLEIYNLIASHPPSADTGAGDYTASVWTEDGMFDRGADFARPDRTGGNRRRILEPRAPPGDRAGDRAFCRLALCADHWRHGVRNILSADPRAGPCRSAVRCPQSWLVARLPRASRFGQSLGVRAHRRGLENQAPHPAPARRHRAGSRDLERRAGA